MANKKPIVGVFFGSRSVEHDVSIVTAHQVMQAFDEDKYEVVPVYLNRDGRWFTGSGLMDIDNYQLDVSTISTIYETHLSSNTRYPGLITPPISKRFGTSKFKRIDMAFSAIHGTHGEDGTIQGLFELADIPYIGTGVLASAIGNNKIVAKALLRQHGVPVVDEVSFTRHEWLENPDAVLARIEALGYPVFIKPATLGSSVGVARVEDAEHARLYIEVAASFSRQILAERAIEGGVEINCAVMGHIDLEASVLEQPISSEAFLTYDDKYLRKGGKSAGMKGADRMIPAPISEELTIKIQDMTKQAFAAINGYGIARIDYLVKPETGEVWLNEINTMPGSLSFYLWEASGKSARQVIETLLEIAQNVHAEKRQTTYNYQSKLLEQAASRGIKGIKK